MLLLLPLLWIPGARALQLEVTPLELCVAVDRVVVAEITDIEPRYATDGRIERLVHGAVSQVVKGPAGDGVDFVLPGGTVGDSSLHVSDAPTVLTNGRYLLFLSQRDGQWHVQGGEQGALRITPEGARVGMPLSKALAAVEGCHAQ